MEQKVLTEDPKSSDSDFIGNFRPWQENKMSLEFNFTAGEPPSTFENTFHQRLQMILGNARKNHGLVRVTPATLQRAK